MTGSTQRLWLTARTVRHLRPEQVAHRVRLRAQQAMLARVGPTIEPHLGRVVVDQTGWPTAFRPIAARLGAGMPSPDANAAGRFDFLHHERSLIRESAQDAVSADGVHELDWHPTQADRLWRFHLHYFEWAWAFVAQPDRSWAREAFGDLWVSWAAASPLGRGDAWAPYVVALRSWVLCGVFDALIAGGPEEHNFLRQLSRHAWFVRRHLERDVGGNHLIKDVKALLGLGVFLSDRRLMAAARRELGRQVEIQVLGDGGHFERSPSYHCQVLEDLLDIQDLLKAANQPGHEELEEPIGRMRSWLGSMLLPDGDVPLFNDCTLVGLPLLALLAPRPAPPGRVVMLADSGYVIIRPGPRVHLVVDVGIACPPDLPAHAHGDCLSFELVVDGDRVVVDAGTSTYEPGPERDYERSTAAHNTVEIDGYSQIEVWGTFRVGRRAQPRLEQLSDDGMTVTLRASHDGYQRLAGRPLHRRNIEVSDSLMTIRDDVEGSGRHRVVARLHWGGATMIRTDGGWAAGTLTLEFGPAQAVLTHLPRSRSFGRTESGPCLEMVAEGPLPQRLITTLRIADPPIR